MTQAQMYANIANAKHSTGPVTEAGKAASAANSLKHGLTARTVVLLGEDEAAYVKLRDGFFSHWKPANPEEEGLVQLLVDTQWRLNRIPALEAACFTSLGPNIKELESISKHGTRLEKLYYTTLDEIRMLTTARRKKEEAEMIEAMLLRRAGKLENKDVNPREFGFVFSVEQLDAAIRRVDAVEAAKKTLLRTTRAA